jgi:hypothetical protein
MKHEAASEVVVLRLTPAQKKRMEKTASSVGLTLSAWVRMTAVTALGKAGVDA